MGSSRNFPHWILACVDAQAKNNTRSPELFKKWAALSAVAGALGRKCWYEAGSFQVGSNLYIALVGPSRSGKGLALALPFKHCFDRLAISLADDPEDPHTSDHYKVYDLIDPLRMIADHITPQKLSELMARRSRPDLYLSKPFEGPRGIFHDSSVTMLTEEFGTFISAEDKYNQAFLTELWDCKKQQDDNLVTRGRRLIRGPCLNWIACAVPTEFAGCLPRGSAEQGLLPRFIVVHYDGPPRPLALKSDPFDPHRVDDLTADLAEISQLRGPFDWASKDDYDKAAAWVDAGMNPCPSEPGLAGYVGNRMSHLIKMSMAISAAKRSTRKIHIEDWEEAKAMLFEAEATMPKVVQLFGMSEVGKTTSQLSDFVATLFRDGAAIPQATFRRMVMRVARTADEARKIPIAMVEAGLIKFSGDKVLPGPNV